MSADADEVMRALAGRPLTFPEVLALLPRDAAAHLESWVHNGLISAEDVAQLVTEHLGHAGGPIRPRELLADPTAALARAVVALMKEQHDGSKQLD